MQTLIDVPVCLTPGVSPNSVFISAKFKWNKNHLTYMVYNTPPKTTLTKADIE